MIQAFPKEKNQDDGCAARSVTSGTLARAMLLQAASAEAADPGPKPAQTVSPLWRRFLLRMLRSLEPLLKPVLHRVESRIRTAIEKTTIASNAERSERHLQALVARAEHAERQMTVLHGLVGQIAAKQLENEQKLDKLLTPEGGALDNLDGLLRQESLSIGSDVVAARNRYGFLLLPYDDPTLIASLADGIFPEPGTIKVFEALLRPGMVVLDIGANVGVFTLLASRLVGAAGRVIALEPTPREAALLRKTVLVNSTASWTDIHELAAGHGAKRGVLQLGATASYNSLYDQSEKRGEIEVNIVEIDAILEPGQRVDLCKIDVEGAELEVLRGMRRVIAENPDMAIVVAYRASHLTRIGISKADWFAALRETGMQIWEIDDQALQLRRLITREFGYPASRNLLLKREIGVLLPLLAGGLP